jgi:hypothetical protein
VSLWLSGRWFPLDRDLGVDGGGVELLVAQELLDGADVRPASEHALNSATRRFAYL